MQPEDGYQDEICPELPRCAGQPRGIAIDTDEGRDAVHAAEGDLPVTARFTPSGRRMPTIPFIPGDETILSFSRNHFETIATYAVRLSAGKGAGGSK
jgi:hypothetical protein